MPTQKALDLGRFREILFVGHATPVGAGFPPILPPNGDEIHRLANGGGRASEILLADPSPVIATSSDLAAVGFMVGVRVSRRLRSELHPLPELGMTDTVVYLDHTFPRGSLRQYFGYADSENHLREEATDAWQAIVEETVRCPAGQVLVVCAHHIVVRMLILTFAESLRPDGQVEEIVGRDGLDLLNLRDCAHHAYLWNSAWLEHFPSRTLPPSALAGRPR